MERAQNGTSGTKEPVLQPVQFVSIKGIPLLYEIKIKQEPLDEAECEKQQMLAAHSPSAVWLPVKTEALCGDPLGQETLPSDWSRGKQVPDLHQSHESVNLLNQVEKNSPVCKREPADALEAVQGPVWEQAGRCVAEDAVGAGSSCGTALPTESRESLAPGPQTRAETLGLTDNHNSLQSKVIFKCDECSKTFACKNYLQNHFNRSHRIQDISLPPYYCLTNNQKKQLKAVKKKIQILNVNYEAQESKYPYTKINAVKYKCHKCDTEVSCGKRIQKHYINCHNYNSKSKISKAIICLTVNYTCKICKKKLVRYKTMQDHIMQEHADACDTELTSQNMTNAVPTLTESADLNTQTVIASSSSQNLSPGLESVIEISNPIKTEPCDSNSTDESILANASGVMNSNQLKSEALSSSVTDTCIGLIETKIEISDTTLEVVPKIISKNNFCPNCSYITSSYPLFKKHVDLKICYGNIFKCKHCVSSFKCGKKFQLHCRRIHKYRFCFKCKVCSVRFKSYCYLANHIVRNHYNKVIFCRRCLKDVPYETYLTTHTRPCVYNTKCTLCNFIHVTDSDLNQRQNHLNNHQISEKLFKLHCGQCLNFFCTKHNLDFHILIKHNKDSLLTCAHCDMDFCGKSRIGQHMIMTHLSGATKSQKALKKLKTPRRNIVSKCSFCPYEFVNKQMMLQHMQIYHMNGFMMD